MPLLFLVRAFLRFLQNIGIKMYDLFIELTNQLFWEGYAEQLAKENPAGFQREFSEFLNAFSI